MLAGRKALAHERPLLGASLKDLRADIPDAVPVLFDRIAKEAHDPRSLDMNRFVKDWNTACETVGIHPLTGQKWKGENPYKGLRPFDESDAAEIGRAHV